MVPGPSVLFVISRGVALGRRVALATVLGNAAGVYVQVIAVAVGVGTVVERSVVAFETVKLAGAAYLVVLGVRAIRRRRALAAVLEMTSSAPTGAHVVREGFVVGVANPKAIVFFSAVLPQFVEPGRGHAGLQMLVLGLVFVVIALVSDGAWGLAAGSARDWLGRSPERLAALGGLGGVIMIGLGLRLAASGRGD